MTPSLLPQLLPSIRSILPPLWNALLLPDDFPLLSWEFLHALEQSQCVAAQSAWQPSYVVLWQVPEPASTEPPRLVAAAPCYLKYDSDGEWVIDQDWAAFAESLGRRYYPKLTVTVPFSPVTGGRLLCSPALAPDVRRVVRNELLQTLRRIVDTAELSSAHILFPRMDAELAEDLRQQDFLVRRQEQYHFHNLGYRSFEQFLGQLRGHRRTSIRRERKALRELGVRVQTYAGLDRDGGFTRAQLDAMFDLYFGTSLRYTGGAPYLNRSFFHLCAEQLGQRLELVLAHDSDGKLLAGAWNLRGATRLFGRYWGVAPRVQIPFLHFEVCYYHSIERCIDEGLAVFEPGHGGEHKLLRGFAPSYTYSAHYLREPLLRQPIAAFLKEEAEWVAAEFHDSTRRCPIVPRAQKPSDSLPPSAGIAAQLEAAAEASDESPPDQRTASEPFGLGAVSAGARSTKPAGAARKD